MIRFYEWLAAKLIVRAATLRWRRQASDDYHEVRHLYAALDRGDSSSCSPGDCYLDRALPW